MDDDAINIVQRSYAGRFVDHQQRAFAAAKLAKTFLLRTSERIDLEVITAGSGRAVLLLPPFGVLASTWMHQVEALSQGYHVVTLNYPGCGRSEFAARGASFNAIAQSAFECLDQLEIAEVDLVGWSMGTFIAQIMATAAPKRVRSLTLVSTVTRLSRDLSTRDMAEMMQGVTADFLAGVPPELTQSAERVEFFKASYAPYVLHRYSENMLDFDFRERLDALSSRRTLIVSGGNDRLTLPEHVRLMRERVKSAVHIELAQAGHCIPLRNSAWFNEKLQHFLEASATSSIDRLNG
jgi:3-oxoadipate enol-lactonase